MAIKVNVMWQAKLEFITSHRELAIDWIKIREDRLHRTLQAKPSYKANGFGPGNLLVVKHDLIRVTPIVFRDGESKVTVTEI